MDVRLTYEDGTIRVVAGDATGNGANDADGDALESLPPPPPASRATRDRGPGAPRPTATPRSDEPWRSPA